jgi:hypothetical protein
MSGAADDWAYEHLGIYGWTTEFWDIVHAATGTKMSTKAWYTGPTDDEALAVLRWLDGQPGDAATAGFVDWYGFDHPQLGPVELGGWNSLYSWINPPLHLLRDEIDGHADFAVAQALGAPCLALPHVHVEKLGDDLWRVEAGVSNTGWLPTHVTERAKKDDIVAPVVVELRGYGVEVVGGPSRQRVGQLDGSMAATFGRSGGDRALASWTVRASRSTTIVVSASHARAGRVETQIELGADR